MRQFAFIAFSVLLALPVSAAAQSAGSDIDAEIQKRCGLCHSAHRVLEADPDKLMELVARMEAKNPEWFKDADKGHLAEGLAKLLNLPQIAEQRKAWEATVARGKAVFADVSLGGSGKSCASCHTPEALRGTAERYPAYDPKLGRYVSLQERLRTMVVEKLGGKELPLSDPRTVELEAYLTTLR